MQVGVKEPSDKSLLLALGLDRKPIPGAGSTDRGGGTDKGSALWTAILMFRLSNGPCKLAPQRPEIHIFPRTCRLLIRQVMWANKPRGQPRSQLFVAAVIFYPSRDDEEENRELGGGIQRLREEMEQKMTLCETSEGLMSGGSGRECLAASGGN